jgi:hypothetical protein
MALADDDNNTPEWVTAEQAVLLLDSFDELETRMQQSEPGLCRLSVRSGDGHVDVVPVDAAWLWQHRGRPQIDYTRSRVFCLYQAPDKPSARWQWASIRFRRNVLVSPAAPSPGPAPVSEPAPSCAPEPVPDMAREQEPTSKFFELAASPCAEKEKAQQGQSHDDPPEVIPVPRKQAGRPPGAGKIDDNAALARFEELVSFGTQREEAKRCVAAEMAGGGTIESKVRRLELRLRGERNSNGGERNSEG